MKGKSILWWLSGALTVLIFLYFMFWFETFSKIANYPPRGGGIVAFGDSLVFGVGATEGHDFVSLLGGMIGEPIENLGVSGDTTLSGLARLDKVVEKHPRIVLLLLGGNDYLRKISREETFRNLETIILRLEG